MVFSDSLFIFLFLPVFLTAYLACPRRFRNALVLAASLLFYAIGEGRGVALLIAVILGNYVVALRIARALPVEAAATTPGATARRWLAVGVGANLVALGWFKYAGFIATNLDRAAAWTGLRDPLVPIPQVALPLGVSFFVFQGISYLVDVYRRDAVATRSLLDFATYKAMFPQLVAGPIVRYAEVSKELADRHPDAAMRFEGMRRFVVGFVKKVLLADTFATVADGAFGVPHAELGAGLAWAGAVAYALQIYFDFSAYSDMAIGLGRIMGFHFPENFDDPYTATSMRDFWRRWHMTLSRWFRDYVYVSLGGNRKGVARTYANLLVVFFLTGLWHGASWTFVAWGLWHGAFLVLERVNGFGERPRWPWLARAYTLAVVLAGWVLFRANDFHYALGMFKAMLGFGSGARSAAEFVDPWIGWVTLAGIACCIPAIRRMPAMLAARPAFAIGAPALAALFVLASAKALSGAYSPFLYFRF